MKQIAVIGSGYVGLVTGTCFAELGNRVTCVDNDHTKIDQLRAGRVPFFEPGLQELVSRNCAAGRLHFAATIEEGIRGTSIVFIAVGTPMSDDGHANLDHVREAAIEIARALDSDKIVVNKSTVPVETGDLVHSLIREYNGTPFHVTVVSNPEFLREGSAVSDFMSPDRVVLGVNDHNAEEQMRALYSPLETRIMVTDVRTAEMIKYTANAFLAMRISFINEIAKLCERVGADVRDIIVGAGSDHRIGTTFMNPGLGFGGSCFPKDVLALWRIAERYGVNPHMLPSTLQVNKEQIVWSADRLERHLGSLADKRIGILGLAFKANTDDVRESPAIALALELKGRGATVIAHDPVATYAARTVLGDSIEYADTAHGAAQGAHALVIATDWNEYKQLDFDDVREALEFPLIYDARNLYDPKQVKSAGLHYLGVGRADDMVEATSLEH